MWVHVGWFHTGCGSWSFHIRNRRGWRGYRGQLTCCITDRRIGCRSASPCRTDLTLWVGKLCSKHCNFRLNFDPGFEACELRRDTEAKKPPKLFKHYSKVYAGTFNDIITVKLYLINIGHCDLYCNLHANVKGFFVPASHIHVWCMMTLNAVDGHNFSIHKIYG